MKRISEVLLAAVILMICFCGCSEFDTSKNLNTVTAMAIKKLGDMNRYTFMITTSSSTDKESGDEPKYKLYSFEASGFDTALSFFEKNFGKAHFGHLSLLLSDVGYLADGIADELDAMQKSINMSPLIKYFVAGEDEGAVLECIGKLYDGSPDKFLQSAFDGERKKYLCTVSELFLSVKDKYFTSSVPAIGVSDDGQELVENVGAVLYSQLSGTAALCYDDYKMYCDFVEIGGKSPGTIETKITDGKLCISIKNKNPKNSNVLKLANKCRDMGFDLLNGIYYCKKCFWSYSAYETFMNGLYMSDIIIG